MHCEEEEITVISVLQKLNRTLRQVNKAVRLRIQKVLEEKDELFLMLCATDTQAEEALWEIWEQGKLECGPYDYVFIVQECLKALSQKPSVPFEEIDP